MSDVRSMTGFGRADVALGGGSAAVEARSVNARHLDVRVRLPRDLAALEPGVRKCASGYFSRGQVEISVRLPRDLDASGQVQVDRDAARAYARAAHELGDELGLDGGLTLASLLSLPGVSRLHEAELDAEALGRAILEGVASACAELRGMREREGEALGRELRQRVGGVAELLGRIEGRADEIAGMQRERLEKRLAALAPEIELDPARLEQEVVVYVDRMDVTEETVRLRSHCEQFLETLDSAEPVGRKLEFLLQEMGREANTIGSKASDAPIAREVVELKAELEKLREQVLNVE